MLPITVNTESGEVRSHVTAERLAEIIAGLGGEGDRFAVVERTEPAEGAGDGGDHYIQTWHEGDGPYEVEYRAGTAERHFGVRMESAAEVTAVFVAWARGEEGWTEGYAWERVPFPEEEEEAGSAPGPDPEPPAADGGTPLSVPDARRTDRP
ncbi:hypothetical protein ACSNOH_15265 [Streptomyces sp. URMC 127]|uniref:hypothetical protein n=1 Tax=Streptomyces sp. URMC 127 TaxID=3423402 RepID=UPI003F1D046F